MKTILIGVGAAGNKAVTDAVELGIMDVEDTIIVNSTTKDFPKNYEGTKIVLSDGSTGCGKERNVAQEYAKVAMSEGKFNINEKIADYVTVIIATSVEGGTGSGATPIIAKMFNKVYTKNVHIIAFTGFEEDVRGISNTVEFFKEIDPAIVVQTISNKAFLQQAGNNRMRAEELANKEMATRISVLTGQDFIEGSQNIDDTDILKLANTSGYMTVEKKILPKPLETLDDFEKVIKNMIYNSASIKSNPSAIRLGIILNISPQSKDAVDMSCESLRNHYGNPYEFFKQIQWDGKKEYIAYIASGMRMPMDEIQAVYDRYIELSSKMTKDNDDFYSKVADMNMLEEDSKFNLVQPVKDVNAMNMADFLKL